MQILKKKMCALRPNSLVITRQYMKLHKYATLLNSHIRLKIYSGEK